MALRTREGVMDVATDIYTNGNKVIAIAGVCHIADASFWENLNRRISGYENMGYSVQYERISDDLSADEKKKVKGGEGTGVLYAKLAEIAGLHAQSNAITYKDHWKNTDITMSEWLKLGKSAHSLMAMISEASAGLDKIIELGGQDRVGRDLRFGLRWMPVVQVIIPKDKARDAILIDLRNEIAADAMLKAEGNVVSIWGAGHLNGIGKILRKAGFKRESRVWTTAVGRGASEISLA